MTGQTADPPQPQPHLAILHATTTQAALQTEGIPQAALEREIPQAAVEREREALPLPAVEREREREREEIPLENPAPS